MEILMLGGTRFLGKAIVESALRNGHKVTLFNRGNNPDMFPEVEKIIGNREGNLSELNGRNWDAVIDTSGFLPWTVERSAKVLRDSGHYTFVSSCSVYQDPSEPGVKETDETLSLAADEVEIIRNTLSSPEYMEYYGHFKALSEQAAEREMPGKVLSIRAGLIVGPYDYTDRLPYWVKRISDGGSVLAPGRRDRQIQLIDCSDLADWIIRLVEKNVTGVFNAVGPDQLLTMEQLLNEIKTVTDSNAEFIWIDEHFLNEHEVEPWGEMPLWIPEEFPLPGQNRPWKGFLAFENQKAVEHGLTFRPLSDVLYDVYKWEQSREKYEQKAGMIREREVALLEEWSKSSMK